MTAVTTDAIDVLDAATIDGTSLVLPPGQLDRKLYVEVDKVLTLLGGKWNRRAKAHVFAADPTDRIGEVLATGRMPDDVDKLMSFWRTPRGIAYELVDWCGAGLAVPENSRWLEPSAGDGAIASVVRERFPDAALACVEPDAGRAEKLGADGFGPYRMTFQGFASAKPPLTPFDAIAMNPPFTEPGKPRAWVEHVTLAYSVLAPGARLAAVVPASIDGSQIRAVTELRAWVTAAGGAWEMLPDGAFKESGTSVRTAILKVEKP